MRGKWLAGGPGYYAERVTARVVDRPALPGGTKLKLGGTLVEVTQIGKKCHSRCNIYEQASDCVMPREGIFVKVLQGGMISDGDSIDPSGKISDGDSIESAIK